MASTHTIDLNQDDRVTIIYGLNGVGKTVLLRLVTSLLSGNLANVVKVPFKIFTLSLTDGTSISVEQIHANAEEDKAFSRTGILSIHQVNGSTEKAHLPAEFFDSSKLAAKLASRVEFLSQIDQDTWIDIRDDEVLSAEEVIGRFAEQENRNLRFITPAQRHQRKRIAFESPDWLKTILTQLNVHLIETQRLIKTTHTRGAMVWGERSDEPQMVATVRDYANSLKIRISETMGLYAKESQILDQTFPQRLLWKSQDTLSGEELKRRMSIIQEKRQQLEKIGLISENTASTFDVTSLDYLDEANRPAMTLYAMDTAKKLGVLDDLAKRIDLFMSNINRKFRHKSIKIDKAVGFIATEESGRVLPLEALSSGEQHELVLVYDLLFRVKSNTLVLIDEPELSLHVVWQKNFLDDLLEIVKTTNFDVLIATHSPFIAGDRSDLMIPLSDSN